jgi:arylsulfatase A
MWCNKFNLNIKALPFAFAGCMIPGSLLYSQEKPNIIFIMADDWGWTDWQMNGDPNGSTFYETPNLNKLAQQGVYFSQAYAMPLCSPSRASLMTGKYSGARLQLHQAITGASVNEPTIPARANANVKTLFPESRSHLPLAEITIAEELKRAGYTTCHFGKWHLGNSAYYPVRQGFDFQFAVGGAGPGSGGYFAPYAGLSDIDKGEEGEYIAERLTREVCAKIEEVKDKPFFIYLAHYNVHSPYEGKVELVEKYAAKAAADPKNRHGHPVMGAMIESLDVSVGAIMLKLKELKLEKNTLVIVMGDNGGVDWNNDKNYNIPITSNYPLRGGKACFYEGGVRVPLIIRYPKLTKPGMEVKTPVHMVDFYPTLLEIAGINPSSKKDVMDGVSILPLLKKKGVLAGRPLFCHFPRTKQLCADTGGSFIRQGDYKLYRLYGASSDGSDAYELYNLDEDLSETNNLATKMPDKVALMAKQLDDWLIKTGALVPVANPLWKELSVR